MCPQGKINLAAYFSAILYATIIIYGCQNVFADEKQIPIEGVLFSETETQFFGTSKQIGDFQADFFKNENGEITHFMVQVGFGFWQFDKIK